MAWDRRFTRREALWLAGGATSALAVGCGGSGEPVAPPFADSDDGAPAATAAASPTQPAPTPTSTPVPKGREQRMLLPDTPWETPLIISNSGVAGPVLLILGGVHGNEPGGWGAAEGIATWEPKRGRLLVVPRANANAIPLFQRTTTELGDLNRLYPGNAESALPMERMAHAIVVTAAEFKADYALDLHESWGFYVEYPGQGTTALGQTITAGVGPKNPTFAAAIVARANPVIGTERDLMLQRDGSRFRRSDGSTVNGDMPGNRGRSSLSLGGHVPGLTPILVEMGQMNQALDRRIELHHIVTRAAMDELEM